MIIAITITKLCLYLGVVKSAKHIFKKKHKFPGNGRSLPTGIKFKASSRLKTPPRYQRIELIQHLPNIHAGPIWTMKFSSCGKLLATGGQDKVLRVWCLSSVREEFVALKEKYKKNNSQEDGDITPSEEINIDKGNMTSFYNAVFPQWGYYLNTIWGVQALLIPSKERGVQSHAIVLQNGQKP